jgi:hypothetical protein
MRAETGLLAVVSSVCMMLALVLAWCLAGVRSSRFVEKCFPNPQYLLKADLDFLMMTGLLFVFYRPRDAQAGWFRLQDRMAALSTNSSHRVVPHTHDALVNDKAASERRARRSPTSSLVRLDAPLKKS